MKSFKLLLLLIVTLCGFILTGNSFAKKITSPEQNYKYDNYTAAGRFLKNVEIFNPITAGNLIVVPVRVRYSGEFHNILAMEEAINSNILKIIESGSVNQLYLENDSDRWVFLMGGEILKGGKQNRILQHDVLLSPWSGRINVGAFCVEQGRWSGAASGDTFRAEKNISSLGVRQKAREDKEQSSVWNAVSETNRKVSAGTPTDAMDEAYKAPKVQANKDKFLKELHYGMKRTNNVTGFVAFINGRVMAADLFGTPDLFEKYREKLMESYTLEAIAREEEGKYVDYDMENPKITAKQFLEEAASVNMVQAPNVGSGTLVELRGRRHSGSLLIAGKTLIHGEIFPKSSSIHQPIQRRPQIEREYPR